jgi:hypothetical protein
LSAGNFAGLAREECEKLAAGAALASVLDGLLRELAELFGDVLTAKLATDAATLACGAVVNGVLKMNLACHVIS